ncbi:hypothetical protein [Mycobacterium canetti]|nr:hypothetical protein [Mycobacterium canetti]CCK62859.1 Conserved protein of unknown function [Mycobacterium canettii CIPT 140070017]
MRIKPGTVHYDSTEELELLNQLWQLVSLRLNFFTPTKKAVGFRP